VVVPAYDESERLPDPLREIAAYLAGQPYAAEIVIVDDGSRDGTFERIRDVAVELAVPVRAFRYPDNRGKGFALKVGFEAARGERVLFCDADLATPIEETAKLLEALDRGADVAIGSRKLPGAEIHVHQPRFRELLGKAFTGLVRRLLADVSDATCGFKAFRAEVGKDLFDRARIAGWAFDAEILFLARRGGRRLVELPVRWEDQAGTKVRLLRDVGGSLLGIARIRAYALTGAYARPAPARVPLESWESVPESASDRAGEATRRG
jgi:dolichyl-phosphate beta-glucosyltransferase